jgi:hypothetical protein
LFSMLPRLLCCTHLNARLQCDLGCPAVLAARIYTTYAPCEPHHNEVGVMNRLSNVITITRPVAYCDLNTTCACVPQDIETAPRAILLFKQMDYDEKGRVPLTDAEVLTALGAHCDRANISTNKPQYGFFSDSKTGPWKAFFDEEAVDKILEEGNILQVVHTYSNGTKVDIELDLAKASIGTLNQGKHSDAFMDTATVLTIFRIHNPTLLAYITRTDIIEAWKKIGWICVRDSRGGAFINGKRIKIKGMESNAFYFNIAPAEGKKIYGSYFPPELEVMVKGTTQFLPYTIGSHPDLDGQLCTAASGCHRYFRDTVMFFRESYGIHSFEYCKGHRTGRRQGGSSSDGAMALADAVAKATALSKEEPCKHFLEGRCRVPSTKCKYRHDGDPSTIKCGLPSRSGGICLLGDKCPYSHTSEMDQDNACKFYASTKPP